MREPWIEIEVSTFAEFKVSELWPDGDAPDTITEADVRALIDRENPRRLIDEWFFPTPDIFVRLVDPRAGIGSGLVDSITKESA